MFSNARSIPLGRVAGIPVRMSWSVLAVSVVGSWLLATNALPRIDDTLLLRWRLVLALAGVLFFLGSILAHEFGHALVARRHNISTSSIRLWIFGGVAALSSSAKSPKAEFQIAIAGPATNAVLAGLFFGTEWATTQLGAPETVGMVAAGLGILNVLLTVTNMIPAAPLDGGRVLSSILWARTGRPEWARLISARIGIVTGGLVVTYGLYEVLIQDRVAGFYTAVIGAFIALAARADVVTASIRGRLASTSVADVLWPFPNAIHDSLSLNDVAVALGPDSRSVPVQRWANETIGYLPTQVVSNFSATDRAWTKVSDVMTPVEMVPSAWTSESLLDALERHGTEPDQMLGIDPDRGTVVGTATPSQFRHLLVAPRIWGGVPDRTD